MSDGRVKNSNSTKAPKKGVNDEELERIQSEIKRLRCELALKLVNAILQAMGRKTVDKLEGFCKVDRKEMMKPSVNKAVESMEDNLIEGFGKYEMGAYRKKNIQNYSIAVLRGIAKEIGYEVQSQRVGETKTFGDVSAVEFKYYYSLTPIS